MKLRLRSLYSNETLKLEVPNTSTVRELKEFLSSRLSSGDSSSAIPPDQFFLTHNELSGSSLQSVGVTEDDLIFYSFSPNCVASSSYTVNPQQKVAEKETLDFATSGKRQRVSEGDENSRGEIASVEDMEVKYDDGDVAYLRSFSVPSFLKKVFDDEIGRCSSSSSSSNRSDSMLLKVAVHAVLLESGLVGYDPISFTKINRFRLPGKFPSSPLHYTIPQVLSSKGTQTVWIKFQNLGKFVNVNGSLTVPNKFVSRVSLDVSRFGPALNLVWKNHQNDDPKTKSDVYEFWNHVKDEITLPLLNNLCESVGVNRPACFMLLPADLMIKILELLPGTDIAKVACVCTELRSISSDEYLWRQIYEQEFGSPVENVLVDGWKLMYSTELVIRRSVHIFPAPYFPAPLDGFPYHIFGPGSIPPLPYVVHMQPIHPNYYLGGFNPPNPF